MTDLERLIGLARIARAVFEQVAMRDNWNPNLCGLCYDASCFLYRLAKREGIVTELGRGIGHWFVLFGDTVIDVTATQFEQPERVMVTSLKQARSRGNWWHLCDRNPDPKPSVAWSDRLSNLAAEVEEGMGCGVGEGEL